jgi:hypothetical protein
MAERRTAPARSGCSTHRTAIQRSVRLPADASFCAAPSRPHCLADRRFDEFAELAGIGDGRSGRLLSAPFRRVISRLPATLHDGIREQNDRPSTLVTDWLNLHTPVGREYVGYRRVDHERRIRPRRTVGVSTSPRPVPIAGLRSVRLPADASFCAPGRASQAPNGHYAWLQARVFCVATAVRFGGRTRCLRYRGRPRTFPRPSRRPVARLSHRSLRGGRKCVVRRQ